MMKFKIIIFVFVASTLVSFATLDSIGFRGENLTRARHDIKMLEMLFDLFKLDNGRYPLQEEGLIILYSKGEKKIPKWKQYIKEVPLDPWGNSYFFEVRLTAGEERVEIYSKGPNGIFDSGLLDDVVSGDKDYNCEFYGSCTKFTEYVFMLSSITSLMLLVILVGMAFYLLGIKIKSKVGSVKEK